MGLVAYPEREGLISYAAPIPARRGHQQPRKVTMRKEQSKRGMRMALGAGIALSLSACDARSEMPLLPPVFSSAAEVTTPEPEGAGTTTASDTTTTQRGAYVGAGY
jgi:hypothetical protein